MPQRTQKCLPEAHPIFSPEQKHKQICATSKRAYFWQAPLAPRLNYRLVGIMRGHCFPLNSRLGHLVEQNSWRTAPSIFLLCVLGLIILSRCNHVQVQVWFFYMGGISKILIFADSQALPRGRQWGNIPYESTYPWVLQRILCERLGPDAPQVIERGMRSRTILDVLEEWEEQVSLKRPDVVVLNIGGSDCIPQILSRWQRRTIERMSNQKLRNRLLYFEFRNRRRLLRWFPGRVHVPLSKFKRCIEETIKRCREDGVRKLILLTIIPISDKLEILVPGLRRNAAEYNSMISSFADGRMVSVVDLDALVQSWGGMDKLSVDALHLRPEGHRKLAEILSQEIVNPHTTTESIQDGL